MGENQELIDYLSEYITQSRLESIDKVLSDRTRHLTVVLEDIYQSHNASAVIRSCDCFGIQDLHIIENRNEYTLNPDVAQGSSKWVNMIQYNEEVSSNTISCLKHLKTKGYKIVATTPHTNDYYPENLPLDEKCALVFGTELTGVSDEVKEQADYFLRIPMYGFTESYNISVSVAICLYHLVHRLRQLNLDWCLNPEEALEIKKQWMLSVIKNGDIHLRNFYARRGE